jgi:hypothetical protein
MEIREHLQSVADQAGFKPIMPKLPIDSDGKIKSHTLIGYVKRMNNWMRTLQQFLT